MNNEERIELLQDRIEKLSSEINSSAQKLAALQAELDILKGNTVSAEATVKPVTKRNPITNPADISAPKHSWLENFIGLKLIHLVGIIVLVTGISIGVKYAVDKQLISESMRIILAYCAGVFLLILSVRLKKKYKLFSAILFSGSMASVYFTTYGASVYYHFIPGIAAFIIMAVLTVYTAIKAISYDSKEIAIIGMIGAYGIPFLISQNAERVDLFFSYILLINIGVVFLSFKKSWKLMGQLAMIITWILFIGWAFLEYEGTGKLIALVFMGLFYVLFLVAAIAFSVSRKIKLSVAEAQQVIINNIALYLAALLVFGDGNAEPTLSSVTGIMFVTTGLMAFSSSFLLPSELLLQRLLTWQSLVFLLLFVAFQWDGLTVTLMWVAISILLFVWGVYKQLSWARLASVFLIGIILAKLLLFDSERFSTVQKIITYLIIGILLLLVSFYYQKFGLSRKREE
jgi:uncharacterized membrane protein